MRWRLLLLTSLAATLVGAAGCLGLAYGIFGSTRRVYTPDLSVLAVFAVPLAAIAVASIFVYRHTARRRPLQAAMTAMISTLLTFGVVVAGTLVLAANPHGGVDSSVNVADDD